MSNEAFGPSRIAVRVAIAFLTVLVTAPPVLIALCLVPANWASAAMTILLLMFVLVCAYVMKAESAERAIIRGLAAAGLVLLVFPVAFSVGTLSGMSHVYLVVNPHVEESIALRNLLLVYDLAIGASSLAMSWLIYVRVQRQAGLDPALADAELRQAFFEVRQMFQQGGAA